nr:hypothetical protein [Tanacetum cinerariifolium]
MLQFASWLFDSDKLLRADARLLGAEVKPFGAGFRPFGAGLRPLGAGVQPFETVSNSGCVSGLRAVFQAPSCWLQLYSNRTGAYGAYVYVLYSINPMELDEHMPVHVMEPKHPEYHAPSDDDIHVKDDNEDPEEDASKEHEPEDDDEDPEEDPNEEHEPEDEDSDETEPFKEDETAATPPRHREVRISVRPQTPMVAST